MFEDVLEDVLDEVTNVVVIEGIIDVLAISTTADEAFLVKHFEALRDSGHTPPELF